ncbi:MAG: potassium-transporting ATPase subunit B, partial [Candidatus Zixiibacteriota bacterium]
MTQDTSQFTYRQLVPRAIRDSLVKLNPRLQLKNPVMFVTLVGACITTIYAFISLSTGSASFGFELQIAIWLWFTVLFANFAEAMAEGRGKAQADSLKRNRTQAVARRIKNGTEERIPATSLLRGDVVVCEASDI